MFVLINDGILYGLSADLYMFAHADACKHTAAHTQTRVIFSFFNMLWSYRNRESTCLSYSVEEWRQLKSQGVRVVSFTCSPHTGNAVKVEPRDLFGVECYMRNYPQNNVLTSFFGYCNTDLWVCHSIAGVVFVKFNSYIKKYKVNIYICLQLPWDKCRLITFINSIFCDYTGAVIQVLVEFNMLPLLCSFSAVRGFLPENEIAKLSWLGWQIGLHFDNFSFGLFYENLLSKSGSWGRWSLFHQ